MLLFDILQFGSIFHASLGDTYVSPLWKWKFRAFGFSPYMAKAEGREDIRRAMPGEWWSEDLFAMRVTCGDMDADL